MGDTVKYYARNVKAKITMKDRWEVVATIHVIDNKKLVWVGSSGGGEEGINYILERFRFAASFNVFFKKLNNIKVDAEVSGFCK